MRHHLHIEESQVADMCLDLYKEYGTTMAGLKALGYEFDNDEFHATVHGTLPYHNLRPDPVFTNSDKAHAEEALCRLGLQGCFDGVICFETLNPCNGPSAFGMLFPDETFPDLADLNESDGFRPISPILCKSASPPLKPCKL
eukprot:XP_023156869.1 uncharacterized protein LOC111590171 [Zea mays]